MKKAAPFINLWRTIKEADLRPLAEEALRGVRIAIVGEPSAGRQELLAALQRDPARPEQTSLAPAAILDLDRAADALPADLIILMMDGAKPNSQAEQSLVQNWHTQGKKVLVFIHERRPTLTALPETPAASADISLAAAARPAPSAPVAGRRQRGVVWGAVADEGFMTRLFVPAVLELIPQQAMALARAFPLFRMAVAQRLIRDASTTNAGYALSTALVETVGVADLPIVVADSFILTKNQMFMVYKLGLALGYSTNWQDYIAEFGGVLGSGFLLRQAARTLVGLVPVVGILPKAGIAYAGTSAVGNAILQWYLTGRHVSKDQLRSLYEQGRLQAGKVLHLLRRRSTPEAQPAPQPPATTSRRFPWLFRRKPEA